MPLLNDLTVVRDILNRDRPWAAYAIGDLSPGFAEVCEWHAPAHPSALLLLYRGFSPPITFAIGDPEDLRLLIEELDAPEISLHLRPEAIDAIASRYVMAELRYMHRMVIRGDSFTPQSNGAVRPVAEADAAAVQALYEDGHRIGEGPTFFHPAMLGQGSFRGIWENGDLVSIAGTHLYSREEGVCAIGNVYTRSDRRGRGLAARVTSAVVSHALSEGVPTIVLNVARDNIAAQRVYERLGFELHCEFVEGAARLRRLR